MDFWCCSDASGDDLTLVAMLMADPEGAKIIQPGGLRQYNRFLWNNDKPYTVAEALAERPVCWRSRFTVFMNEDEAKVLLGVMEAAAATTSGVHPYWSQREPDDLYKKLYKLRRRHSRIKSRRYARTAVRSLPPKALSTISERGSESSLGSLN